ncbi:hypothetical protein EXT46_05255 [Pseudoalteromonas sp. CO325X]|uniref:hypothetical protein n=1 Tax=Pseudoalteromonas sp. CO325X TaxID=1777262 RepID=UPI001022F271|nr:hypothetical protein [Pseudoalteromonas sp. CO325X]RZF83701.1 hypothetical protein EXT46_05255 [Pseudoalteromonas sp. CO325X]
MNSAHTKTPILQRHFSIGHLFILIVIVYGAYAFFAHDEPIQDDLSATKKAQQQVLLEHFTSSKEPTVKDAIWASDGVFKVGVIDDGTNRDGYAKYVCQVITDLGYVNASLTVQVIDIAQLKYKQQWIQLGASRCQ